MSFNSQNRFIITYIISFFSFMLQSCEAQDKQTKKTTSTFEIQKTEQEWKKILSPEAFYVLRQQGTERAFTGKYYKTKDKGVYHCAGCDNPLFSSEHKYDSGTGWPSFWQPIQPQSIGKRIDYSHGMVRNEVYCAKCGGHLGHVFDDGPKPTGLRYCINSVSLVLKKVQ